MRKMASTSTTNTGVATVAVMASNGSHSEIPPWKIELIQRKKKFSAMSPTQRAIMQYDINNDANSDKTRCDTNGLVAAKVFDYSLYSTSLSKTSIQQQQQQIQHQVKESSISVIQQISFSNGQRKMDGIGENGNSVAGHSHFQPIATATPTPTAAAETALIIINGDGGSSPSNVLPVSPKLNSVSPDAMTQRLNVVEVGTTQPSPQPMTRKSLEMKDKFKLHTSNQFHSRHDSEEITSSSNENINIAQSGTSCSLVSDRKQQLEQIGKCAKLNQSFESATTKQQPQQSPVLQKFLKTSEKRSSVPNWFPSKRNSLALLANQQLESASDKSNGDNMVAMQELATATNNSNTTFDDNSEELQYGPGIVSKLRCRYLSLALRQTVKQRPTLDNLRRANSMSNLLEEENVDIDEVDDRNADAHNNSTDNPQNSYHQNYNDNKINSNSMHSATAAIVVCTDKSQMDYDTNYISGKCEQELKVDSRRQIQRGNDSLKRARSVEALMRYDTLAWRRDVLEDSEDYPSSNPIILDEIIVSDYQSTVIKAKTADSITIEDKIQQARDRMMDPKPPKRLTSFMSETERPPPDLVKQTLLKFEASANKRTRTIQRYGNGDVAAKVATYKSKMSQDKSPPMVAQVTVQPSTAKLPPSGFGMKKPLIKPRTTSPKPAFLNGIKDNPLSKKSIYAKSIEHDTNTDAQNFNGNSFKLTDPIVERMNQKNIPQVRIDTTTYRNKYEFSSPDSSPNEDDSPLPSYVFDMVRRRESNHTISPLVSQLAGQTESLVLSTPKLRKSDVAFNTTDDSSIQPSDNDELDDVTSNSSETGWSESYDVNISDNDSDVDENFVSTKKPPPIPKNGPKLNGGNNHIKATVISVQPTLNGNKSDLHQPEPSVRQIGIIRPLNHDAAVTAAALKPPIPIVRKLPSPSTPTSTEKESNDAIKVSVAAAPIVVSTQHSVMLPSSTSSVVVTNSVSVATSNDVQGDVVVIECSGDSNIEGKPTASTMSPLTTPTTTTANNRTKLINTNNETNTISIDTRSIVHQKNLLNKEKSEELLNGSSQTTVIQSPIKWNIKKSTVVSSSPMSPVGNQSPSSQSNQSTKHRPNDIQTTNTMVFNFSNRKDVPDYIENDGLVIRRKRELPKPGESGFVVLGDLTVETSTDPEPDDSWICDPPSPCDVQFKNANVVINGKSSLRDKTKTDSKNIRFNENLTSIFEYPSESSLCDDIGLNGDSFDDDDTDLLYSNGHFLGSSPIASVPLGNYQPIKIFNTNFELGVTRTHNSSPNQNASHKYQAPPPPPPRTHSNGKVPKSVSSPTAISSPDHQSSPQSPQHQQLISVDGLTATPSSNGSEPDSLQYLKPANEDAVAWSEGASDLLF